MKDVLDEVSENSQPRELSNRSGRAGEKKDGFL